MIDWSIRVSDILVIVSLLGSGIVFSYRAGAFSKSIEVMQKQIASMEQVSKTIAGALTTLAVQKVQIERIEKDVDGLKRGEGYVQQRNGLNGEYD